MQEKFSLQSQIDKLFYQREEEQKKLELQRAEEERVREI